jgi:hypothetical protein
VTLGATPLDLLTLRPLICRRPRPRINAAAERCQRQAPDPLAELQPSVMQCLLAAINLTERKVDKRSRLQWIGWLS